MHDLNWWLIAAFIWAVVVCGLGVISEVGPDGLKQPARLAFAAVLSLGS